MDLSELDRDALERLEEELWREETRSGRARCDRDVAQVTYNGAVTYGGVVQHARRNSIWSRTPDGWALRFHQGTPIPGGSLAGEPGWRDSRPARALRR